MLGLVFSRGNLGKFGLHMDLPVESWSNGTCLFVVRTAFATINVNKTSNQFKKRMDCQQVSVSWGFFPSVDFHPQHPHEFFLFSSVTWQ